MPTFHVFRQERIMVTQNYSAEYHANSQVPKEAAFKSALGRYLRTPFILLTNL